MSLGVPGWVQSYIGIPFATRGFDRSGCHCWGLVWLAYREHASIALCEYAEFSADDLIAAARAMSRDCRREPWRKVNDAKRDLDVLLMLGEAAPGRLAPVHVGIVVGGSHVLHVEKTTAAVCVRLSHPSVKHRMLGAYRHRDLQ